MRSLSCSFGIGFENPLLANTKFSFRNPRGETSITAGTRECTWRVAFVMRAHHLEKPRENTARTEENTFQDHEAIVVERKRVGHIISSDG